MNAFLQQLKQPKYRLSLVLLAVLVFFTQSYLVHHQIVHDNAHAHHDHHDSHETGDDCTLCLAAHHSSELILPVMPALIVGLMAAALIFLSYLAIVPVPAFLLPQTRAPPLD